MTSLKFVGDWSLYIGVPVALLAGAVTWLLYRRESRQRNDLYSWLLPAIRTLAIMMLILMLTGPVLHHRWVVGQLARILVFVDASQSMGVTDDAMTPARKILAAAQLGLLSDEALPEGLLSTQKALTQASLRRLPAQPSQKDRANTAKQFHYDIKNAYAAFQKVKFDSYMVAPAQKGSILYENWNNFSGTNLNQIRSAKGFPDKPADSMLLKQFQGPVNWSDRYCDKISGYIHPPATGEYTFWINSDDQSWLFLSDNDLPAGKKLIAKVGQYTALGAWEQNGEQKSKPVNLQAGRRYYIEALHAEGTGNDHVAVGWRLPDGTMERPIPGSRLSPFKGIAADQSALSSRQAALEQFRTELLEPAERLAKKDSAKDADRFIAQFAELDSKTEFWQKQLSLSLEQWGDKLAKSGADAVNQAIEQCDEMTRIERIQALLLGGDEPLLAQLAEHHNIDLIAMSNADVEPLWRSGAGRIDSSTDVPEELGIDPTGKATNLTVAPLTAIGIRYNQTTSQTKKSKDAGKLAVVIFSDGRHNFGKSPVHQAKICGSRGIPIFTVASGSLRKPQDMAVTGVEKPLSVFHKDRVKGAIALKDDMHAGKEFVLRILSDSKETLWEKQLTTTGLGRRIVDYDFAISELLEQKLAGKERELNYQSFPLNFTAVATGLEDFDAEAGNNQQSFRTRAIFQHNRALILDGRPRWEFRYIRNLLDRDEKWDLTTVLADPTAANGGIERGDSPAMFPSEKEFLYTYDLIILGDFPSTLLRKNEIEWIREAVGNRGVGLILIDGLRKHLQTFAATPLAELFPIEWDSAEPVTNPESLRLTEKGVLRLTEQGADLAALALSTGEKTNSEIWASLQPPHWLASIRPLPGTEVLVEAMLKDKPTPAIAFRRFGAGKVLFTAFDETWRWRYRVADEYHQRYWNQVSNLIMATPFAVSDRFVSIDAGSLQYTPGQSIQIRARIRDTEGRPVSKAVAKANIFLDGKKIASVPLEHDKDSGEFRGRTAPLMIGDYEVRIEVMGYPESQMLAKAQFYVEPPRAGELAQLVADEQILKQMALNSGGDFFREENASALSDRLRLLSEGKIMQSDTALWQSYLWFAAVVLLLTIEWILRKRAGML
ncbi:MAG: PA14 domain-containing protein [Planctomycetota bacterium]|jgi:hypothetical protein